MCIGLAYHKDMKPGQREEIQPGKRPTTLAHNSLKPPNVLLDFPKPGDGEHGTTPLLKVNLARYGRKRRLTLRLTFPVMCR